MSAGAGPPTSRLAWIVGAVAVVALLCSNAPGALSGPQGSAPVHAALPLVRAVAPALGTSAAARTAPALYNASSSVRQTLVLANDTLVDGNVLPPNPGIDAPAITYDPAHNEIFLGSAEYAGISIVSVATGRPSALVPLPSDSYVYGADGLEYDAAAGGVLVADTGLGALLVVNDTNDSIVTNISIGGMPIGLAFDPSNGLVFVSNLEGNVAIVNLTTGLVVGELPGTAGSRGLVWVPTTGELWVVEDNANAVAAFWPGNQTQAAVFQLSGSADPRWAVYDAPTQQVFVTENGANAVQAFNAATDSLGPNVTNLSGPIGEGLDSDLGLVLVSSSYTSNLSFIATSNDTLVGTADVGSPPGGITFAASTGVAYATTPQADDIIAVTPPNTTSVEFLVGGFFPSGVTYTPGSGTLFVNSPGDPTYAPFEQEPLGAAGAEVEVNASRVAITGTTSLPSAFAGLGPCGPSESVGLGEVFVAGGAGGQFNLSGPGEVGVLSASNGSLLATIAVPAAPIATAYDPSSGLLLVTEPTSGNVSLIATLNNTVLATFGVGQFPTGSVYDPATGDFLVSGLGGNGSGSDVVELSGSNGSEVGSISGAPGLFGPGCMAYDPSNQYVYVVSGDVGAVVVLAPATQSVVASIPVGDAPSGIALDVATGEAFVTNSASDNVTVLDTSTDSAFASIPVGVGPLGVDVSPTLGEVFVTNSFSGTISVIAPPRLYNVTFTESGLPTGTTWAVASGNSTTENVTTASGGSIVWQVESGSYPFSVPDTWYQPTPASGTVVVGAANVNVSITFVARPTVAVAVRETNVPRADLAEWGLAAGFPAERFVADGATLGFAAPVGALSVEFLAPSGFGLARILGAHGTTQSSLPIESGASFTARYGPYETLTFTEVGLGAGVSWGVDLTSPAGAEGPPSQYATSNGTSLLFLVVKGAWKFDVAPRPADYAIHPSSGTIDVPAHAVTKRLAFRLLTSKVEFRELGLPPGSPWTVRLSGTVAETLSGSTGTLAVALPNGSYFYSVASGDEALSPFPANGTFPVVVPHAAEVFTIDFLPSLTVRSGPTSLRAGAVGAAPTAAIGIALLGGVAVGLPQRRIRAHGSRCREPSDEFGGRGPDSDGPPVQQSDAPAER